MTRAPGRLMSMGALLAFCAATPVGSALASDLRMTVEQPHFTCEGNGDRFSRVAYHPGVRKADAPSDAPLPCCDGQIGCAQFLSTNTVVRQAHSWHG